MGNVGYMLAMRRSVRNGPQNLYFGLADLSGVNHTIDAPFSPTLGTWHHVAGTWDGTTMRAYVDGVEVGNRPFSGTIGYGANEDVYIGVNDEGTPRLGAWWNGNIDEVRISDTALNPTQFLNHPNPPGPWDLTADFSKTNNPAGVWSYGWEASVGAPFTLFDAKRVERGTDTVWYETVLYPAEIDHSAHLWKNETGANFGEVPDGWVSLHPGPFSGVQPAVARWTSPVSGIVSLSGMFAALGGGPATDAHIQHNGSTIWERQVMDGHHRRMFPSVGMEFNVGLRIQCSAWPGQVDSNSLVPI